MRRVTPASSVPTTGSASASSGIPDQWMVHQIDALHFVTGLQRPRSVVAQGGIYSWRDGRINPDTVTAVFDYGPLDNPAKGFQAIYSSRMHNSAGGDRDLYRVGATGASIPTR